MLCVSLTAIGIVATLIGASLIARRPDKSGYRPRRLTRAERLATEAEQRRNKLKSHSTENLHLDKWQQLNQDLFGDYNPDDTHEPP